MQLTSGEIGNNIELNDEVSSTLEEIWHLMDKVWDELGCDNIYSDWNKIKKFYRHPVRKLNGSFIEQHEASMQHRHAISDWLCLNQVKLKINKVVDYGGGFGTLAKLIAQKHSEQKTDNISFPMAAGLHS